jgi:predicted metal-binding protein
MTNTLHVCRTCSTRDEAGNVVLTGEDLFAHLSTAFQDTNHTRVHDCACMGGCDNGCIVALQHPHKTSLAFHSIGKDHADDLKALADSYTESENGILKKGMRPETLRDNMLAKLHPAS